MNTKLHTSCPLYTAALLLSIFLANGQSLLVHLAYAAVTFGAAFMSLRQPAESIAVRAAFSEPDVMPVDNAVIYLAHVEELLSQAS